MLIIYYGHCNIISIHSHLLSLYHDSWLCGIVFPYLIINIHTHAYSFACVYDAAGVLTVYCTCHLKHWEKMLVKILWDKGVTMQTAYCSRILCPVPLGCTCSLGQICMNHPNRTKSTPFVLVIVYRFILMIYQNHATRTLHACHYYWNSCESIRVRESLSSLRSWPVLAMALCDDGSPL